MDIRCIWIVTVLGIDDAVDIGEKGEKCKMILKFLA